MNEISLTPTILETYAAYLRREEKSPATIEKYLRDVRSFAAFAEHQPITKDLVVAFKRSLIDGGYAVRSINSMLASVNSLLSYLDLPGCKVKNLRQQRQTYCDEAQELTKSEYLRLLDAARARPQLMLLMETICGTSIRVSELRFFTVEAVRRGDVTISCKSKTRKIIIPGKLRRLLLDFAAKERIRQGPIFVTRTGTPLNRCNIWAQMKRLCDRAGVPRGKVFPHNLRRLFARTFYGIEKDIAKLADILGHSSIDTTRIYIMTSGKEHRRKIERLGLVI